MMLLTSPILLLLHCLVLSSFIGSALTQSASGDLPDLVQLLETTPELSIWHKFVTNYTEVESLYSTFENTTCFAVTDSANNAFFATAAASFIYETGLVPSFLQYMCVHGIYNTSDFTTDRLLMHSYLTNSTYTNVTGGQTLEGLEDGGDSYLLSGLNIDSIASALLPIGLYKDDDYPLEYPAMRQKSRITDSIPFKGGLLHIIDSIATPVYSVFLTSYITNLTAMTDAANMAPDVVAALDSQKDLTLVVLTDATYKVYNSSNVSAATKSAVFNDNTFKGREISTDMFTKEGTNVTTQSGRNVTLTNINGQLYMNNVSVVEPHIPVDMGAIYLTEGHLFPISGEPKVVVKVVTVTSPARFLYGKYRTYTLQGEFTLGPSSTEGSFATQPSYMTNSDQP